MRTLAALFFTLRLLLRSVVVYNLTRLLPAERRSRVRYSAMRTGAREIADFCLRQGGIFLKASQYLSTVSNVFDAEFTEIFASVPDRTQPRPYEEVRYRFLKEFGKDADQVFAEFDRTPLAAASLGQVHVGRLTDGRKVAIKLLHTNMELQIRQDLRALRYVVELIRRFYRSLDFRQHLNEFASMLQSEIDYQNEAENMRRARDQWDDEPRIVIPDVIADYSHGAVLTVEFIDGIQLKDEAELDRRGIDRRAVTELLLESYARMILSHRFYHADPHPGNVFVLPADSMHPLRLAFVDFGAAQVVTERTLDLLQRFVEIMRNRDIPSLTELLIENGLLDPSVDRELYNNLFEMIQARYGSFRLEQQEYYRVHNPVRFGRVVKLRDLGVVGLKLREIIAQLKLPRKYIYLIRTITMLLSQAMKLDSRVNVFRVARPYVDRYMSRRSRGLLGLLRSRGMQGLFGSTQPPVVNVQTAAQERGTAKLYYRLGQQALFGMAGAACALAGAYLYAGGWQIAGERFFYGAIAAFALMAWQMLRRNE